MGELDLTGVHDVTPPNQTFHGSERTGDELTRTLSAANVLPPPKSLSADDTYANKVGRVAEVTAVGTLGYGWRGIADAALDDIHNWPAIVEKVGAGVAIGAVMKTLLPAKGAVKAIAGTVMLGAAVWDLSKPVGEAWSTAWSTNDENALTDAERKLGKGVGSFVWDSGLGMAGGMAGERAAVGVIKAKWGPSGYSAWETKKETFFEKREGLVGRVVAPTKEALASVFTGTKEFLNPTPVERHLPAEEALAKANEAAKRIQDEALHKMFYKTPLFSHYIDGLVGKGPELEFPEFKFHDLAESNRAVRLAMVNNRPPDYPVETVPVDAVVSDNFRRKGPDVSPGEGTPKGDDQPGTPRTGDEPGTPRADDKVPPRTDGTEQPEGEHKPPADPADGEVKIGVTPAAERIQPFVPRDAKATTTPAEELHPEVINGLAQEAKARQEKWALSEADEQAGMPSKAAIADFRDQMLAPIQDTTDVNRKGALFPPEYKKSSDDLGSLLASVEDAKSLQDAGPIVRWHSMAASQRTLGNKDVMALNLLAREMHGNLLHEMRKLGVTKNVLENTEPSLVTITEDGGSGNFTIPRIEDVLRRAITIFPRNQSELVSVFGPINFHENLGHDDTFPMIALLAEKMPGAGDKMNDTFRQDVILQAVKNAFGQNHIEDGDIRIGDLTVKKSQVFAKMLLAEANENTADMIGTAASGLGTPLSLGTLLQSLRPGGMLENRNVFGRRFGPDIFEPHGFDRWRVKLSAEVMRHLSKGDARVNEFADALDVYADKATRPGDSYTYANTDAKGQVISIPYKEWDAIIPHIVKTQFDTPLPALETPSGRKTLADVVPNFVEMFHKTDELATKIADTVLQGKTRFDNFDADTFRQQYSIGNVFNANLLAWVRVNARGGEPSKSLDTIRGLWENLRDVYLEKNPNQEPLTPSLRDNFRRDGIKALGRPVVQAVGNVAGDVPNKFDAIGRNSNYFGSAAAALYLPSKIEDLRGMQRQTKQIVGEYEREQNQSAPRIDIADQAPQPGPNTDKLLQTAVPDAPVPPQSVPRQTATGQDKPGDLDYLRYSDVRLSLRDMLKL